jgi:hypothetical protein
MEDAPILFTEAAEKCRLDLDWHVPKEESIQMIMIGGGINKNMNEIEKEKCWDDLTRVAANIGKAATDALNPNFTHPECDPAFRENNGPLKDSGTRDVFSTGAVRDADTSKGRMDLVPMDIVGEIIKRADGTCSVEQSRGEVFAQIATDIERLIRYPNLDPAYDAIIAFGCYAFENLSEMILELSVHFKDGAVKYAERNWEKLIPLHRFLDSSGRHMVKWYRGDTDEGHSRAAIWNLVCYIWTVQHADITNTEIYDLPWCDEIRKNG